MRQSFASQQASQYLGQNGVVALGECSSGTQTGTPWATSLRGRPGLRRVGSVEARTGLCRAGAEGVAEMASHASLRELIQPSISSNGHAVIPGPSRIGAGNLQSRTQRQIVPALTGSFPGLFGLLASSLIRIKLGCIC